MSVKIRNRRVLLKKLEGDIATTLASYVGQELNEDRRGAMASAISKVLDNVVSDFNADLFEFTIHRENDKFSMEPNNFISALWLRGVDATIADAENGYYEDSVAIYQWEDEKLVVTPKSRVDLL